MRTTEVLSITLPPPMLKEARDLARQENRTMSELVREALRQYQQQRRWDILAAQGQISAGAANVRSSEDVVEAIHQFRRDSRRKKPARSQKPARKTA